LGSAVHSFEKRENGGIQGLGRSEGGDCLDSEVSVANDVTLRVDLLGSGIVVLFSIYEVPGFKVVDRHLNVESGVGLEILTVCGGHKLSRRHICGRGNDTHRSGVTRTTLDLLAIRKRLICGEAEIDKVVGRGE
jgi:hypothetical protein